MRVKRSRTAFLRPMGTGRESERQFSNVTGIGRKQGPASGRVLSSLSSTSQNFRHILLCYVGFSDKKCSNLSPTYFVINSRHRPWLRINLSLFWIQFCQYCENFSCIFLVIERPTTMLSIDCVLKCSDLTCSLNVLIIIMVASRGLSWIVKPTGLS